MDFLNTVLAIAKPSGLWGTIINAFEQGVGSYLLTIVLITLILRVLLSPFDTINKRISKKQAQAQAKIQPQLEELQKKYGHDRALLNQKTQALYKKAGMSVGGSCLFMLAFMAINLTIFFSLFSALNLMADYKINQQYLAIKESYSNVLNLVDVYEKDPSIIDKNQLFQDFENMSFKVEKQGNEEFIIALNKDNEQIYKTNYKDNFSYYSETEQFLERGDITDKVLAYDNESEFTPIKMVSVDGEKEIINYYFIKTNLISKNEEKFNLTSRANLYEYISSDKYVKGLIRTYIEKEEVSEGQVSEYVYIGDEFVKEEITLSTAIQTMAMKEVFKAYDATQKENSFLWIGSIWVADSPFKNSIFTFNEYKAEIGANNISPEEEVIYNSFMTDLRKQKGRVNGYFILAIISIGVSALSIWLGQRGTNFKNNPNRKSNLIMMIVMPSIMGIFAILYNSVFAIYLVVSQAISAAITPLSNLIVKKWEEHDKKKQDAKQTVVDYRRKW